MIQGIKFQSPAINITLFGIVLFMFASPLQAKDESTSKLIMCTDFTEQFNLGGGSALTTGLVSALYYRQAAVFTTQSLLYNVLYCQRIIRDFATMNLDALRQKYSFYFLLMTETQSVQFSELCKMLVAGNANSEGAKNLYQELAKIKELGGLGTLIGSYLIKFDQWVAVRIDPDHLCLLIPKEMLGGQTIMAASGDSITDLEFTLGLKVNHLQPFDVTTIAGKTEEPANPDIQFEAFKKISVSSDEYHKYQKAALEPLRYFVFDGHGSPYQQAAKVYVAGMLLTVLVKILEFCENLRTGLVSLLSCYSAGINLLTIIQELEKILKAHGKQVTYVITSNATSENPTITPPAKIEFGPDNSMKLVAYPNYGSYFPLATTMHPDFIKLTNELAPYLSSMGLNNIPVLVIPGQKSAYAINVPGTFAQIDEDIIAENSTGSPLNIRKAFSRDGKNPAVMLLMVAKVPFSLILDYEPLPSFVSLIPGDATHELVQVNAPLATCEKFLNDAFANFPVSSTKKYIWIKELVASDGKCENLVFLNHPGPEEVEQMIYYTKNGNYYRLNKEAGEMGFKKTELKEPYVPTLQKEWATVVKDTAAR